MQLVISGTGLSNVNFAPASEAEEIIQNVKTILATVVYSVVMDRQFGVVPAVDDPLPVAKARLAAAYVTAVQKYEPRAKVIDITFTGSDGIISPTVRIGVNE